MNDFTRGYMRGYKDAQKEALAQPEQRSVSEHLEPVAFGIKGGLAHETTVKND